MAAPQLKECSCSSPTPSSIPGTNVCTSCFNTTVLPSTSILLVHRPELGTSISLLFSLSKGLVENHGIAKQQGNNIFCRFAVLCTVLLTVFCFPSVTVNIQLTLLGSFGSNLLGNKNTRKQITLVQPQHNIFSRQALYRHNDRIWTAQGLSIAPPQHARLATRGKRINSLSAWSHPAI